MRIVYEQSGFPRELTERDEWRKMIASGSLRPETIVTVVRAGEAATVLPTGEVAELSEFFSPVATPSPPVAPLPAAVPSPTAPAPSADQSERSRPVPDTPPPPPPPTPSPPPLFSPTKSSPTQSTLPAATAQPQLNPDGAEPRIGAVKWLVALGGGLLVLLIVIVGSLPSQQVGDGGTTTLAVSPADATGNETAAVPGEAIAEGVTVEWNDTGTPKTYAIEGLEIVLSGEKGDDGTTLPVMTVRSAELGDSKIVGVSGGDTAAAKFMVVRPSRADRSPSILFMTYSMGAHCCTNFKLLTPRGDGWALADLGNRDGEPLATAPVDVDNDGILDFVLRDDAFLYAFASYADSFTPSRIYNVVGGKFVDRSTSSRFRSVHLADIAESRSSCASHNNGACAAYVASAARVGEAAEALAFASANFDPTATEGWLPMRCLARADDGSCPAGSEQQPADFVEALDWFLQDNGYVDGPIAQPVPETDDVPILNEAQSGGGNNFSIKGEVPF